MAARRGIEIKTPAQLVGMRRAGLVVQRALAEVAAAVAPGVTTAELDAIAIDVLAREGAASSFLRYGAGWGAPAYPAVTCISVNEVIVHGIPSDRALVEGDLVSVDFGAIVDGWHGDSAVSIEVGRVAPAVHALSAATRRALWAGIGAARLGGRIGDIGHAVQASIEAEPVRYGIVEDFTGHGIGRQMHQPPDVPNFGRAGRGARIVEGVALAVEPMVTTGDQANTTLPDEWTVVTDDHGIAAHWEHTMTVTRKGIWVLTAEDGGEAELTRLGAPFGPLGD